jgi:signal transduction histidine kinase
LVPRRHSLLVGLIVTTAVVTVALSWAGWRLLGQQRDIDERRAQESLGATADTMAAAIREKLAEAGERLSAATTNPAAALPTIANAAVMTSRADGTAIAATGLPFVPAVADTAATDGVFVEAEDLEFAMADLPAAAGHYEALATHRDPGVRAGALTRLARVSEKRGDTAGAIRAYQRLEESGDTRVNHLPARFIALYQQRGIAARSDAARARQLTATLTDGLNAGGWLLTRGVATLYRDNLGMTETPASWPLAEAVERTWQESSHPLSARGQKVFSDGPRSVLVMWRGSGAVTATMAAFLDGFLPGAPPDAIWHLADPSGRRIAGYQSIPPGAASPRVVGDSEYAWVLHVGSAGTNATTNTSERTLVAMMAAVLMFLWGAMYFMARAIRREAVVARLQSDFVAAVSHEFRSPLTTIRQMSEMLEMGRVTSDERRQAYYGVLTGEASRLQRLVETLLNFGRMEAGAARYRLDEIELGDVVRRVVSESEPPARESGKRIIANGPDDGVVVRADASALALAIRNLIDNAVKYSPGQPDVRVSWGQRDGQAMVEVVDHGVGIPPAEQQAIFDKFVRGRSAIDSSVAGTGVGLAMVRQILRAHGGEVGVESEVGQGSSFTLTLPLTNSQIPKPNSQIVREVTEARS